MEAKYTYKRLDAYLQAKALVKLIYGLLKRYPAEEKYALCDQLRRAVISVPSNIAEGLSRFSDKEKVHFLEIAYGSLMEVDCQIEISYELGYIGDVELKSVEALIQVEAQLLSGLRAKYTKPLPTTPLPTTH